MIYTDGIKICADTKSELMAFARASGMHTNWFKDFGDFGYFEIFGNVKKLIMRADGVQLLKSGELLTKARQMYNPKEIEAANGTLQAQIENLGNVVHELGQAVKKAVRYKNPIPRQRKEIGTAGSKRGNEMVRRILEDDRK